MFPLGSIIIPGNTDPCVHNVLLRLRVEHLARRWHLGESAFQPILQMSSVQRVGVVAPTVDAWDCSQD